MLAEMLASSLSTSKFKGAIKIQQYHFLEQKTNLEKYFNLRGINMLALVELTVRLAISFTSK